MLVLTRFRLRPGSLHSVFVRYLTGTDDFAVVFQKEAILGSYFSTSSIAALWAIIEAAWDMATELGVEVLS